MKGTNRKELYKLISYYFGEDLCANEIILNRINFVSEDVDAFFEDFQNSFNIDMSNYDYYDYFHENFLFFGYFISISLTFLGVKKKKVPISVNHLLEVIEKGVWFKPIITDY